MDMDQSELSLKDQETTDNGPAECLGKTFANDEERRTYFLGLLAEKLKDPEFRKIEGFPIGEDEDILNLSDPPYYTACPNPWIADFIARWEKLKPQKGAGHHYHREPFAADVSEGKGDPIYNAHSYHTKVPHKAIMRYILHYTNPGDIVFDGFSGTGMTGIAAQMCGDRDEILSLGYQIKSDGTILKEEVDSEGQIAWLPFSKLGVRHAVLNDLSPAASFIASNYNTPTDTAYFEQEAKRILRSTEEKYRWMYETKHVDGKTKGVINYTIWSDVFVCPECAGEVVYWNEAVPEDLSKICDEFTCPSCSAKLNKRNIEHAWITKYDYSLNESRQHIKRVPVLINYKIGKKRFTKSPDDDDLSNIDKIEQGVIPFKHPITAVPKGDKTGEPLRIGITHAHDFYTKRNLWVMSALWDAFKKLPKGRLLLTSVLIKTASLLHNIGLKNGKINLAGALPNAIYIPSNIAERNLFELIGGKLNDFSRAKLDRISSRQIISTSSLSTFDINDGVKFDYIFIDPPFGSNLHYSELSFLWDAWLGVVTNNIPEAIENRTQGKNLFTYMGLMTECFKQAYASLKPAGWMTVEFSNTSSAVWNSIQTALTDAGFVVGNVSALSKGQGTFNSQTNPTSVKQDLIISAYKPNGGFEERFSSESDNDGIWDFVRTHLGYLPVSKKQGNELVKIPERDPRILFDQVVAYFVRNLRDVPLSSKEFQDGLLERFAERDGMIFLPEQVAQYDKARITSSQLRQLDIFVDDEASAIEWLRQLLNEKPQTYQDIHPKFINELTGWKKAEVQLELSILLEQNFLKFDGNGQVPPQIHSYLSTNFKDLRNLSKDAPVLLQKSKGRWYVPNPEREEDLQQLRERDLLKQFEDYKSHSGKKIKSVRMEAVRCGFKKAWQDRDYATIINVAEKIPQNLLQEDQKLLMWYDQAQTRSGDSF